MSRKVKNLRCELVSGEEVSQLEKEMKDIIEAVFPDGNSQKAPTQNLVRII